MSRRKVTMLEAFQASAKGAAERAAAERRTLIAERERAIRRGEATRTAGRLRRRGSAGGPPDEGPEAVGSGAAELPPVDDAAWSAPDARDLVGSSADTPAGPQGPPSAPPQQLPAPPLTAVGRALDPESLHAAAALEETLFTLPMTARTFIVLQLLLLGSVFFVGWSVGGLGAVPEGNRPMNVRERGNAAVAGGGLEIKTLGNRGGGRRERIGTSPGAATPRTASTTAAPQGNAGTPGSGADGSQAAPTAGTHDNYTAADRAFEDPAMKFTVLAITYTSTETNVGLAWQTYDLFRAEGLPAVRPIERGSRIYLFVGAAEAKVQLKGIEDQLRPLRSGSSGSKEFRSAHPVNIDRYR